jgi:hypothetical protein
MENDFDRAFTPAVVHQDRDQDALPPGLLRESKHCRLCGHSHPPWRRPIVCPAALLVRKSHFVTTCRTVNGLMLGGSLLVQLRPPVRRFVETRDHLHYIRHLMGQADGALYPP